MKFRCKMSNTDAMKDFINIVSALKMSSHCILKLTPDELCFIISDDKPIFWAQLTKDYFFHDYTMNGVTDEHNKIYLEFETRMLTKSLSSLKGSAKSVKIKLTNKQQPCLTFDIEMSSMISNAWNCIHDVPITIIPRNEWASFEPPEIPQFDMSIELPRLKVIRHVVERKKNMTNYLTVAGHNQDKFVVKFETFAGRVTTFFPASNIIRSNADDIQDVSATIGISRLLSILAWDSINPDPFTCNILQDKLVYLSLDVENYKIHYFIPAVDI